MKILNFTQKNSVLLFVLIIMLLQSNSYAFSFNSKKINKAEIKNTLLGAASYLHDMQIQQRKGKLSCLRDSSSGDGCSLKKLNVTGEWANHIYMLPFVPYVLNEKDRLPILDSNMFVTAGILYPLYWLEDSGAELNATRNLAIKSIQSYKRNNAYNFWPKYISRQSNRTVVGPINFRVDHINISNSSIGKWASNILGIWFPWVENWMKQIANKDINPWGMESFFNVPNDADDTSMAMTVLKLESMSNPTYDRIDLSALDEITRYRDVNRRKHDSRDDWTEPHSGAYLTWLKDENLDVFSTPETGVMPLGVNNVDCVVNANALLSLSINDMSSAPGFYNSALYLAKIIESRQWINRCALYYPQIYTFPYSVTRAFRDGEIKNPELDNAMDLLMLDLLDLQKTRGYWISSIDGTRHYATAMALVSLLNLGEKRALLLGKKSEYNTAILKAINFLIREKEHHNLNEQSYYRLGYKWKPGLFFSAEEPKLGVWRSTALTNAIIIEALAKFLINYHKENKGLLSLHNKLQINE